LDYLLDEIFLFRNLEILAQQHNGVLEHQWIEKMKKTLIETFCGFVSFQSLLKHKYG
jgi:hypothetical protein